jgi:hypothetical protein
MFCETILARQGTIRYPNKLSGTTCLENMPPFHQKCNKENLNSTKIKHHKLSSQAKLDEPKPKPK